MTIDLVLELLPSGEFAWLRMAEPEPDPDERYWITEAGRDAVRRDTAERWLFA